MTVIHRWWFTPMTYLSKIFLGYSTILNGNTFAFDVHPSNNSTRRALRRSEVDPQTKSTTKLNPTTASKSNPFKMSISKTNEIIYICLASFPFRSVFSWISLYLPARRSFLILFFSVQWFQIFFLLPFSIAYRLFFVYISYSLIIIQPKAGRIIPKRENTDPNDGPKCLDTQASDLSSGQRVKSSHSVRKGFHLKMKKDKSINCLLKYSML